MRALSYPAHVQYPVVVLTSTFCTSAKTGNVRLVKVQEPFVRVVSTNVYVCKILSIYVCV